jgi:hypothetical protein
LSMLCFYLKYGSVRSSYEQDGTGGTQTVTL